mgnify:CR=1 FL=1
MFPNSHTFLKFVFEKSVTIWVHGLYNDCRPICPIKIVNLLKTLVRSRGGHRPGQNVRRDVARVPPESATWDAKLAIAVLVRNQLKKRNVEMIARIDGKGDYGPQLGKLLFDIVKMTFLVFKCLRRHIRTNRRMFSV